MPVPTASGQPRRLEDKWELLRASEEKWKRADIRQATCTPQLHQGDCGREQPTRISIMTSRTCTFPSELYGWATLPPKTRNTSPSPAKGTEELSTLRSPRRIPLKRSERARDADGTGHVGASEVQCDSIALPVAAAEVFPSVAKTLLHERIDSDLHRLLQELLGSAAGRADLQCTLHLGVERGLLRGSSCSFPGISDTTTDDALLRGFWSANSSGPRAGGRTNGINCPHQLQQLCVHQFDRTQDVVPQHDGTESAHARAHNRPKAQHLCRLLGSKGELVHISYTPYQQNISKGSGQAPDGH